MPTAAIGIGAFVVGASLLLSILPVKAQSPDEIAQCQSIMDAQRRAYCLNGIGPPTVSAYTDCPTTIRTHGFLSRAQFQCGFASYSNEMMQAARTCAQKVSASQMKELLSAGMQTFDRNEKAIGHAELCRNILRDFANIVGAGQSPPLATSKQSDKTPALPSQQSAEPVGWIFDGLCQRSYVKRGTTSDDMTKFAGEPISCNQAVFMTLPNGRKMINFLTGGGTVPLGFSGEVLDRKSNPKLLTFPVDRIYPIRDLGTTPEEIWRRGSTGEGVLDHAEGYCFFSSHSLADTDELSCGVGQVSGNKKITYYMMMKVATARPVPANIFNDEKTATPSDTSNATQPPTPEPTLTLREASDQLMYCVNPEAQYGRYSSFDGGQSVEKILEGKCTREGLAFVDACVQS